MAKKIPSHTLDQMLWFEGDVPLAQQSEFAEYREFMAAYCEARLWWLEEAYKPDASPIRKFWFANRYASSLCYGIMEAWHRGYWLSRAELAAHCTQVPNSQFVRVMKAAQEANYISLAPLADEDARQKLVRPTRPFIVMFEAFTYQYYKIICENSHKHNQFTQGLRERVDQIEQLDELRQARLGWTCYDQYPELNMSPPGGTAPPP